MTRCPKCGSNRIHGPTFVSATHSPTGRECLTYACLQCGYAEAGPCADAKHDPQASLIERMTGRDPS